MELFTLMFAAVLALVAVVRSPRISAPQLVGPLSLDWSGPADDEEEDQRPETDRAPSSPKQLWWAVGCVAAARAVAFVALGA